ncbi:hypothetical protein RCH09_000086 [Actimicrobium sp. GrIS 1.19]|uniref:DUF3455 domain-containing protein n=1 Tax=Actimicrobium sp. GrIS 1.19 TaxID=3071708 RepID=UPI002DFF622F|nr:hypothetical protein [Actimicrobium sp. GrIS 1.19]
MTTTNTVLLLALATALAACAGMTPMATPEAPAAVSVPAGNKVAMTAVGSGDLGYECRAKAATPGAFEWVFTGPNAMLLDKNKTPIGKYYAGPTWESNDGSKVTGKQLAVAPGVAGAIPLQLVQANPATGNGAMSGVTYIQRLKTVGGVAPAEACAEAGVGTRKTVKYQADYVFYKAS